MSHQHPSTYPEINEIVEKSVQLGVNSVDITETCYMPPANLINLSILLS